VVDSNLEFHAKPRQNPARLSDLAAQFGARHKGCPSVHATGKASLFLNETVLPRGPSDYNPSVFSAGP